MYEIKQLEMKEIISFEKELKELLILVLRDNGSATEIRELSADYYKNMLKFSEDGSAIILGAIIDQKLVGFLWGYEIRFLQEKRIHVSFISIYPENQGKRVGTELLNAIRCIAEEREINAIEVLCAKENETAFHYYMKNGFEIDRYKMVKKV